MGNVRLLSETVSNQIAAGEVVERPASVVKELIENALDAGATRISVEIQAGGRSLIRVSDNGVGMNRDDALLCLDRHATSKIQSADDLASIATMGFRGEAIPSIASVGRMTLTTLSRENESGEGTRIEIHGGKIRQVESAGQSSSSRQLTHCRSGLHKGVGALHAPQDPPQPSLPHILSVQSGTHASSVH